MTRSRTRIPAANLGTFEPIDRTTQKAATPRTPPPAAAETKKAPVELVYAGIGSRETPPAVLQAMTELAGELAARGWTCTPEAPTARTRPSRTARRPGSARCTCRGGTTTTREAPTRSC